MIIMENMRGEEGRKGQPHNNSAGGRGKTQAPTGFEGMNYEQKRKPYKEGNVSDKDRIENPGSGNNLGNRRDDL
jgi:hypothetical protein